VGSVVSAAPIPMPVRLSSAPPARALSAPVPPGPYPEPPAILTIGFSLYIAVWFLEFGQRVPLLGQIRFEFLLGAVMSVAAVVAIMNRTEDNRSRLTKYICAYFLYLFFHLILSQYFEQSWNAFVDWIVKFSCMALFTYAFVRSPRTLKIFVGMLLVVFLKIGQEAFLGQITGSMVWENQGIMRLHGETGFRYGHPNSLSGFAVGVLPFLYYFFPVVKRRGRIAVIVALIFAFNMILFAGSRTGYVTVLGLSLFLWARSTRKGRFVAVFALIAMIAVPLIPPQYESRFMSSFVGEAAEGHSKEARIELANDAWSLFVANPQGLGIYAFRYALEDLLEKESYDPHNLYLQALVDLGAVGALIFGVFIAALYRELRSTESALAETEQQLRARIRQPGASAALVKHAADVSFMRATTSAFLAYLFTRLVLGLFGHDLYEIYWWITAGASIAIANLHPLVNARTAALMPDVAPAPPNRLVAVEGSRR
jgi:putative inorganic carbon (HCO3(-)) transporter